MAKVFGKVIEEEVNFLIDPEVEFVSLVKYAANRMPFKIIKQEDIMGGMLYRVLVPKDIDEEKLKELAEKYSFKTDKEVEGDFKSYKVFEQDTTEKSDDVETVLVALDKDEKVYAVVAKTEEKQESAQTLEDIVRAMYAMEDIIYGTLSQPAAKPEDRINMIKNAIQNFMDYAMVVLSQTKADDVIEEKKKDDKKEEKEEKDVDIAEIVAKTVNEIIQKQQEAEKMISEFKENTVKSLTELIDTKIKEIYETISKEVGELVRLETFEKTIDEIKKELESMTTVVKRGSELGEGIKTQKQEDSKPAIVKEFKFFTAI